MKKPRRWIFFYQESGHAIPRLTDCVGTGSVIPVDNRLSNKTIEFRVTHGYYPIPKRAVAFGIHCGGRLIDAVRRGDIRMLTDKRNIED